MKKILFAGLMCICFSVAASASALEKLKGAYIGGNFGIAGSNNLSSLEDYLSMATGSSGLGLTTDLKNPNYVYGFEIGYENPLISQTQLIGLKAGYNWYSDLDLDIHIAVANESINIKSKATAIPVTVYYKSLISAKTALSCGIGATYIETELSASVSGSTGSQKDYKLSPHITMGAEYKFTEFFALGIDFKYTFDAKFEQSNMFERDLGGLSGAVTARFYAF